jgi:hypothetical protein
MRKWFGGTAVGVALFAAAMLLDAAPAYADSTSAPGGARVAAVLVFLAASVVLIVAVISFRALRRAAARKREQDSREHDRQRTSDRPEGPG